MSMVINSFWATPSGGPDPYWNYVVLLMGFDGANGSTTFIDESSHAHTITTFGNAQISTTAQDFGTGCYLGDGTGDYATAPDDADWDMGGGDFTIECFVRFKNTPIVADPTGWMGQYDGSSGGSSWQLIFEAQSLRFNAYGPSTTQLFEDSGSWLAIKNIYYHIVIERFGTVVRLYRDGSMVKKFTGITGAINNSAQPLRIGGVNAAYPSFDGRMDEVRITKGIARYNSDSGYPPITQKFPRSGP